MTRSGQLWSRFVVSSIHESVEIMRLIRIFPPMTKAVKFKFELSRVIAVAPLSVKIFRQRDKEIRFIIVNRFFGPLCCTRCLTGSFQIAGHERDSRGARTTEKKERKRSLCASMQGGFLCSPAELVLVFVRPFGPSRRSFRFLIDKIVRSFDDDDRTTKNHVD